MLDQARGRAEQLEDQRELVWCLEGASQVLPEGTGWGRWKTGKEKAPEAEMPTGPGLPLYAELPFSTNAAAKSLTIGS